MPVSSVKAWPRTRRLRLASDFVRIKRRGKRCQGKHVVVYVAPAAESSRLAVVTSRKVGNAVKRNRWRRRIRELFRTELLLALEQQSQHGCDCLVIVTSSGRAPSSADLKSELRELLKLNSSPC